jgi:excisionase family DNA binding protein
VTPLTLNVREAAELIGTSEAFVRRAVSEGVILSIRVGRLVRIPRVPLLRQLGAEVGEMVRRNGVDTLQRS